MPEERVDLEEGLTDSPPVRAQVNKVEKDLAPFKEFTVLLRDTLQVCGNHQKKACESSEALSKLLSSYQGEAIGDPDKLMPQTFARLSQYLSELHSCQEMLNSQLQNAVIDLLSQFLSVDFGKLEKLKESQEAASVDHEQATIKFSRISKKRDTEKTRFESNSELFTARKKFCETSLDYYSELNCFQHKKKLSLLEPLLTFMHAQMAYFKVGHEILNRELANFLTDLDVEVQSIYSDYQKEVLASAETQAEVRLRFPNLCLPDPDPTDPFAEQPIMADTSLVTKASYLFIRTQTGFPSKWDRAYFFTKKGYLYIHMAPKPPELIVHLKGAEAVSAEMDDRRYVFVVSHSSLKRPLYLLAESELQKEEWVWTINNIGQDRSHAQSQSNAKRDEAVIKMEREKIRSWVNKEIEPKKEKAPITPKHPKTAAASPSSSLASSQFPSLPSFLNFRDSSNQSDESSSSSTQHRKSPIFFKKGSSTPKPIEVEKGGKEVGEGGVGEAKVPPQSSNLPSPLQPERLTVGASPSGLQNITFSKTFFVKYLGHMEVQEGRNITVIMDTIQRVVTARAVKNKREAQTIEMTITHKSLNLLDNSDRKAIGQIFLKDVLRCAIQSESVKLFGIVNRTSGDSSDASKHKFLCHVMEAETTGLKVCSAINEAIQVAAKILQSKHSSLKSSTPTDVEKLPREEGGGEEKLRKRTKVGEESHKDQVNFSEAPGWSSSSSVLPTPPSSSASTSRLSNTKPQKKSATNSNWAAVSGQASHNRSGQAVSSCSKVSLSTQPTSVAHKDKVTSNGGQVATTTPRQKISPAKTHSPSPSFSIVTTPLKQTNHQKSKKQPTDGIPEQWNFQQPTSSCSGLDSNDASFSSSFTSSVGDAHSKSASVLSVAAASGSDYYQMPSSLQSGADMLGEISSPLTPTDLEEGYLSVLEPGSLSTGEMNPELKLSPSIPISSSTSMDSANFQSPGTAHYSGTNTGLESGGGSSALFFIGGGTGYVQSQGSVLPSFTSNSSYTVGACVDKKEGLRPSLTGADDIFSGEFSFMNKTSTFFDSSSSKSSSLFPPSSFFNQSKNFAEAERDPTSSDRLPSPNTHAQDIPQATDSMPLDISWTVAAASVASGNNSNTTISGTQSKAAISSADSNIVTSHVNFPVSFQDQEGDDFGKFGFPPLPDSLNPKGPSTSGFPEGLDGSYGDISQGGYGGSIVTLGNPANPANQRS